MAESGKDDICGGKGVKVMIEAHRVVVPPRQEVSEKKSGPAFEMFLAKVDRLRMACNELLETNAQGDEEGFQKALGYFMKAQLDLKCLK